MLQTAPFFVTFFLYIFRLLFRNPPPKPLRRSLSLSHPYAAVPAGTTKTTYHKFSSLRRNDDDHPISPTTAVVIDVEGALLKSTSMFPYFMLVAFEAGSFVRAAVLLLFYPFLRLLTLAGGQGGELELKLMVFISFFGLTQKDFSVGSSVLPRAFLSDVALEAFEAAKGGGGKVVAVCGKLPRVMVESFLKDYLEVEFVVARELRVVGGYFVGALEEDSGGSAGEVVRAIGGGGDGDDDRPVGIARFSRDLDDHRIFSLCKEIYLVRRADKASWRNLPRQKYPKPLIFHDGRLAAVPTPLSFLALLVWTPFGLLLAAARLAVAITLPYTFSVPILYFSGFRTVITQTATSSPNSSAAAAAAAAKKKKGQLYVCNHRTLLDPLYLSFTMNRKFTAVTYSLSRVSELLSPIPTVRLNRDRVRDAEMMDRLLGRGDLVVCPEGTTCREPYLLRFSPLFAELTEEVVPVAMDVHVDMFYGTTASGLKCLDPLFFLLNPRPEYCIRVLDPVSTGLRPGGNDGPSRYDVANRVQRRIGDALGFECTKLTRKDKYMALAGNEGIHYNP